jgi:transcriptional regulator with XRE-family HTH domain
MINTDDFVNRLQKVMDFYGESASSFAEKIGVQRSSISHVLSGRNKPSLDFVLKILSSFPEVELYWLLNGKGTFPPKTENEIAKENQAIQIDKSKWSQDNSHKSIDRIVIFFSDGSFQNFEAK